MARLLPANTLSNVRVGVSVSESPDLGRLGLLEAHLRLTLGEITRAVLLLGGSLQYCGNLDPNGYTMFLLSELKRYARRDDPLSVVLAWPVHRHLPLRDLRRLGDDLGLFGSLKCLDATGALIDFAAGREEAAPGLKDGEVAPALTAMRQTAVGWTNGRVLIGGRRTGYGGVMPGVLEEALVSIVAGQPVFLAGGFGGVTHDIVRAVDPSAAEWLPVELPAVSDSGFRSGIDRLTSAIAARGWNALANGLDEAENTQLVATHRPSEIATLVSLGLGRIAQASSPLPDAAP